MSITYIYQPLFCKFLYFKAEIKRDYFPYFIQGKEINISSIQLHAVETDGMQSTSPKELNDNANLDNLNDALKDNNKFDMIIKPEMDDIILSRERQADVFILIMYFIGTA